MPAASSAAKTASKPVPKDRKAVRSDKRKKRIEQFPEVNFGTLHMNTLKRYKKHYKLNDETTNKAELVDVVSNHFKLQEVIEMDSIMLFSHMIKHKMNKFDQKEMQSNNNNNLPAV
eukprot:m.128312 g.128312  ORF g.128312 m.128312 type:complete len:116 (-) comp29325_c0_seq1:166-513(-)